MRLIDADYLKGWLTADDGYIVGCNGCTDVECLWCVANDAVDKIPTVDAESVKHGKWVSVDRMRRVYCSSCGNKDETEDSYFIHYAYCPRCGAKMDLK